MEQKQSERILQFGGMHERGMKEMTPSSLGDVIGLTLLDRYSIYLLLLVDGNVIVLGTITARRRSFFAGCARHAIL